VPTRTILGKKKLGKTTLLVGTSAMDGKWKKETNHGLPRLPQGELRGEGNAGKKRSDQSHRLPAILRLGGRTGRQLEKMT